MPIQSNTNRHVNDFGVNGVASVTAAPIDFRSNSQKIDGHVIGFGVSRVASDTAAPTDFKPYTHKNEVSFGFNPTFMNPVVPTFNFGLSHVSAAGKSSASGDTVTPTQRPHVVFGPAVNDQNRVASDTAAPVQHNLGTNVANTFSHHVSPAAGNHGSGVASDTAAPTVNPLSVNASSLNAHANLLSPHVNPVGLNNTPMYVQTGSIGMNVNQVNLNPAAGDHGSGVASGTAAPTVNPSHANVGSGSMNPVIGGVGNGVASGTAAPVVNPPHVNVSSPNMNVNPLHANPAAGDQWGSERYCSTHSAE